MQSSLGRKCRRAASSRSGGGGGGGSFPLDTSTVSTLQGQSSKTRQS